MFVDTRGIITTLNATSWKLLAPTVDVSTWTDTTHLLGSVHGTDAKIHLGTGRLEGVNSVGMDWLSAAKLVLLVDYRGEGCMLLPSDQGILLKFPQLPAPAL